MSIPIRCLEYCLTYAVLCCAELLQQLCLTLCSLWTVACWLLCPWDYPGKNTLVCCHALLQGNLPDLGIKPISPASPELQAGSLPTEPPGKAPLYCMLSVVSLANHEESMGIVFHVQGLASTKFRIKNMPGVLANQHECNVAAEEWRRMSPGGNIKEVEGQTMRALQAMAKNLA